MILNLLRKYLPVPLKIRLSRTAISAWDALLQNSQLFPARVCDSEWYNPDLSAKLLSHDRDQPYYVLPLPKPAAQLDKFGLPVPPVELWEGYGRTVEVHLRSGETHVSRMLRLLEETDYAIPEGGRVLDFGCATGRMIRWLYPLTPKCEIWGVDIKAPYIAWCQAYLSPPFYFATTTTFPHLPFEDHSFDAIYAASVFTHISELAEAWLLELRRILRPGGRLYVTVHDTHTINVKLHETPPNPSAVRTKQWLIDLQREAGLQYDSFGMFAIRRSEGGEQVYYDTNYLRQRWERFFKICSITPLTPGFQTAVILTTL